MKVDNAIQSKMWREINDEFLPSESSIDISNFRNERSINNKLLMWDPYERSTRYFKNFLYEIVKNTNDLFRNSYSKVSNTLVGNPITVSFNGVPYNIDYVASVFEVLAMQQALSNITTVCEIGAGFGRTAHTILNIHDNIQTYTIVDLPEMICLSREFLMVALPKEQYEKVVFVTTNEDFLQTKSDMFINIDSFAEMDKDVVAMYLSLISDKAKYFYCKNPIGKYTPEMVGIESVGKEKLDEVMEYGLCNEVVDIFDNLSMASKIDQYVEVYRPSNAFEVINHYSSEVYAYYHHVLYHNKCSQ